MSAGAGEYASFRVEATGYNGGEVSYKWQYSSDNGESWRTWTGKTEAEATAKAGSANNGFLYRCRVSNEWGSEYSESARLTLTQ